MNNQICIIAEKPSVAREIARIVGATERAEGYLKGNGYYVTWAFGHLVMPALPEGYGIKGFHRDNLPIIPPVFTLVPRHKLKLSPNCSVKAIRLLSPPMQVARESLSSAIYTSTSDVPPLLTASGSVRLPTKPSVRDWKT